MASPARTAQTLPPLPATLALLGRLAGRALLAGVLSLALLELALRAAGLPEGVTSVRAAYDIDDSTPGVYDAGSRIFVAWPSEIAFEAHFNSFGARGAEPVLDARPPILALGASTTFGFGVGDDETWPAALERRLRAAGSERPVLNFGSPRLVIEDHLRILRRALPMLRPDVVILLPNPWNGGYRPDRNGLTQHERAVRDRRRRRGDSWLRPLIRSLAVTEARLVGSHWRQQLAAEGRGEYPPLARDRSPSVAPKDMGRFERGVAAIGDLVESHGATLVVLAMPTLGSQGGRVTFGPPWTEAIARRLGVHHVDLHPAFSRHPDPNPLFLLPYDDHPSPAGHQLMADTVLDTLRRAGLAD